MKQGAFFMRKETKQNPIIPVGIQGERIRKVWRQRQLYFMILPAAVLIFIFTYIPLFGWVMAFTDYKPGRSMFQSPWAGLKYFKEFFTDTAGAGEVIRNTLVMNVSSLILGLLLSMAFAILLKEIRWKFMRRTIQSFSFFPYFMSWVILYAVLYALVSNEGALNGLLISLGMIEKPLNLLGNPATSWGLIIGVNLWATLGYDSVIFISAIAGIPQEQYEAARIDGASRWSEIRYITIPNLIPTLVILLIMSSGNIFNSYLDQFFVFTNTLNISTMQVFDYYIYNYGLKMGNYSYATAVGIVKTLVSFGLLTGVNFLSRKLTERSLF